MTLWAVILQPVTLLRADSALNASLAALWIKLTWIVAFEFFSKPQKIALGCSSFFKFVEIQSNGDNSELQFTFAWSWFTSSLNNSLV